MITTGELLPCARELDLGELWDKFLRNHAGIVVSPRFLDYLSELVCDPRSIDQVSFCGDCGRPGWDDELYTTGNNSVICESCREESWITCESCEGLYQNDDLTSVLDEALICDSCRGSYYSYCEDCEGWYHDDDYESHSRHGGDGCCESPQREFTIRNDGFGLLANDTRITVTLPAGIISGEGIKAISRYLRNCGIHGVSCDLDELGNEWQAKNGNFAKRLSRQAYQAHGTKLSQEVLSQVGYIAREHSNPVSVDIKVTRNLNQDAKYFYHGDSCWWGSYSESRCALKTNGGFGLRSFDSQDRVSGRAWVLPLKQDSQGRLVPTFETRTPAAFVVFNGYGDLSGYAASRIMAHLSGWTYRKTGFSCSYMYVNGGSGYLVAPEVIAEKHTELRLDVLQHSHLFEKEHADVT